MEERRVRIRKEICPTIFKVPKIRRRVDSLFNKLEDDIKSRFNEINTFINDYDISYEHIVDYFRMYFCKNILNEAVKMAFTENRKYNIKRNILKLLSEKKLKDAILGEPMIYAFNKAISELPTDGALDACLHGSTMMLLEKNFLGKSIYL